MIKGQTILRNNKQLFRTDDKTMKNSGYLQLNVTSMQHACNF